MKNVSVFARRQVLRGMLGGSALSVGLPILDCVLNTNGDAFANGAPIPLRLATWMWPFGLGDSDYRPKTAGKDYELPVQLTSLKPFKDRVNLFSGGEVFLDGMSNNTHFTGVQGLFTGKISNGAEYSGSLDTLIGDVIGKGTRFRSIEVSAGGDPRATWSARNGSGKSPAEVSPLKLYTRIFGAEFVDPNAANFTPDPEVMVRKSVLSAVSEQRQDLMKSLGAADRARMDTYFTSLRMLEQKLAIQLEKPAQLEACRKPDAPQQEKSTAISLLSDGMERHDLFAKLLAHALACGQTRVVNSAITTGTDGLRMEGETSNHHTYTHEEPVDPELGYQVESARFQDRYMRALHDFVAIFDGIKEGDRSMLDRMVVYAFTDHSAPRLHSLRNYPQLIIGSGGGRFKTGMHIPRQGDAATRVGLTLQVGMGVPVSAWGTGSNRVTSPISEVLA